MKISYLPPRHRRVARTVRPEAGISPAAGGHSLPCLPGNPLYRLHEAPLSDAQNGIVVE